MPELKCSLCGKIFYKEQWICNRALKIYPNQKKWFCGIKCSFQSRFGHKTSKETKRKIALKITGVSVPSKGRFAEESSQWKGDNVKYHGLHKWIKTRLPKPEFCEFCNIKPSRDLANITGHYNRELHNWKYLCHSCHVRYDKPKAKIKRRQI
jgi:hypothetical protein